MESFRLPKFWFADRPCTAKRLERSAGFNMFYMGSHQACLADFEPSQVGKAVLLPANITLYWMGFPVVSFTCDFWSSCSARSRQGNMENTKSCSHFFSPNHFNLYFRSAAPWPLLPNPWLGSCSFMCTRISQMALNLWLVLAMWDETLPKQHRWSFYSSLTCLK